MNRKQNRRRLWAFLMAALLVVMITGAGLADAGGFSGGSDYGGGGSWSGGSDNDWGSDSGGIIWGSDGGSSGGSGIGIAIAIVLVIIYVVMRSNRHRATGTAAQPAGAQVVEMTGDFLKPLREADPGFSAEALLERVGNMYVQMQDAWEKKRWEPIRMLMTDVLFNQFNRQLGEMIEKRQTNHVDNIAVLDSRIVGYSQDDTNDVLRVLLRTRIVDYYTDDKTGDLIRGSKTRELFMTYEWTLIRRKGVKTDPSFGRTYQRCPACGAPMSINQSGKCEFCGVVVSHGEYDWVISAIRGVSQQSGNA